MLPKMLKIATALLTSCNGLVINNPLSGCVPLTYGSCVTYDSCVTTGLLQVVDRLVA